MDNIKSFIADNFLPWERLNEAEKLEVLSCSSRQEYKKGSMIQQNGEKCQGVLMIEKGDLRVYILSEDGREITLYRLTKGDMCIFSAACVLHEIAFDVNIEAESDCSAVLFPVAAFKKLSDTNVYVENFSYKLMAQRFSDVMWAMQQILFMSMDKRLAILLYSEGINSPDGVINMTHEQIAKYMGSAREVVTRMLKYFSDEKIVSLSRGKITILDKKKLYELQK